MDETDFLLQEALLLGASQLAAPEPKSDTDTLVEMVTLVEKMIAYRAAKKTIMRDSNGRPTSVVVEGHGIAKVVTGADGLIKSLGGITPMSGV